MASPIATVGSPGVARPVATDRRPNSGIESDTRRPPAGVRRRFLDNRADPCDGKQLLNLIG
jgi:hypothetical protein